MTWIRNDHDVDKYGWPDHPTDYDTGHWRDLLGSLVAAARLVETVRKDVVAGSGEATSASYAAMAARLDEQVYALAAKIVTAVTAAPGRAG